MTAGQVEKQGEGSVPAAAGAPVRLVSLLTARADPATAYRALAAACLLALLLVCLPTLQTLPGSWSSLNYSSGYVVAALAVLLVARELWYGPPLPNAPSIAGLLALVAVLTITLVGYGADVMALPQFLLPPLLLAGFWTLFGATAVRRLWPALIFLYFAIPFWQDLAYLGLPAPDLNEGLRALSTVVVTAGIRMTSIPAYIEGNYIYLPSGTFEIAEGCSGLAYFVAAIELALFYGLMYLRRWRSRLVLVASAAALALCANWIRIFILILIGYFSRMQNSLVADHDTFGWLLFFVVVAPLVLFGRWLEGREPAGRHQTRVAPAPVRLAGFATGGATLAALVASLLLLVRIETETAAAATVADISPPQVAGWRRTGEWAGPGRPVFPAAGTAVGTRYERQDGGSVAVFLANYAFQSQGSEVVHFENRPQGEGGEVANRDVIEVVGDEGDAYPFEELLVTEQSARRIVWYGKRIAGRHVVNGVAAKLYQAVGAATGRTDAQVVILSASCEADCTAARALLSDYASRGVSGLYAAAASSVEQPKSGQ